MVTMTCRSNVHFLPSKDYWCSLPLLSSINPLHAAFPVNACVRVPRHYFLLLDNRLVLPRLQQWQCVAISSEIFVDWYIPTALHAYMLHIFLSFLRFTRISILLKEYWMRICWLSFAASEPTRSQQPGKAQMSLVQRGSLTVDNGRRLMSD